MSDQCSPGKPCGKQLYWGSCSCLDDINWKDKPTRMLELQKLEEQMPSAASVRVQKAETIFRLILQAMQISQSLGRDHYTLMLDGTISKKIREFLGEQ